MSVLNQHNFNYQTSTNCHFIFIGHVCRAWHYLTSEQNQFNKKNIKEVVNAGVVPHLARLLLSEDEEVFIITSLISEIKHNYTIMYSANMKKKTFAFTSFVFCAILPQTGNSSSAILDHWFQEIQESNKLLLFNLTYLFLKIIYHSLRTMARILEFPDENMDVVLNVDVLEVIAGLLKNPRFVKSHL